MFLLLIVNSSENIKFAARKNISETHFVNFENSLLNLKTVSLYSEDLHLFTFTNLHIMVIHHQSLRPHSGCTFEYFKIGSTDLNLNVCNENLCNSHYEPAINIFLQRAYVFSVKCFIYENIPRIGTLPYGAKKGFIERKAFLK